MSDVPPELDQVAEPAALGPASDAPSKPGFFARLLAIFIPVAICLGGVAFAGLMVATRPAAERTEPEERGVPVSTAELQPTRESVVIRANGQVIPARQVVLSPEVSGRVTAMNPHLIPGGRVAAGDQLIRVDARDYRAAVQQSAAQVESSQLTLTQENSRRVIAEREWALLGSERGGASETGEQLALREPQTRAARASVSAAQAGLRRARTNLSRTTLRAPFDAIVQAENVDVGQFVGPQSQVATLIGTETFWVRVSIPMDELAWIRFPDGDREGSGVTVIQRVGDGNQIARTGRVIRLLGDLDPVGRMARVLVEIDDPLGTSRAEAEPGDPSALPMLVGAFVEVEIAAGELDDVYEVPRTALHANDQVYLFGDGALEIREVEVVWRRPETVLARGVEPGEVLVTSALATPVAGTALRHAEDENESEPAPSEPTAEAR